MGTERDPYLVLGVNSSASQAEITRAFHRLLYERHPDTRTECRSADPAADEQLQHVLAAYSLLRDPERRAAHDRRSAELDVPDRGSVRASSKANEPTTIRVQVTFFGARPHRWARAFPLWVGPVRRHR
ncbi:J domain-containing protein [Rhodococcus chondri]|uniref:J domain-containing protein n=1 Tax=Rhodococcus chondri TaxID=3065941 RepID=A0ABU7JX55_9NOCA|nr:J domain-containing protein [Rhodococcus sp. CC-R104]MEE2034357.1 J domain-containing protein [Rhodococcus sp. CC-R104]